MGGWGESPSMGWTSLYSLALNVGPKSGGSLSLGHMRYLGLQDTSLQPLVRLIPTAEMPTP